MAKVPKQLTPFKKGQSGNPKGRPVGSRSFKTLYNEAIIKIAEETGEAPLDIERDIVTKGAIMARKGDYRFYKDTLDRVYGAAGTQEEEKTAKGNIYNFFVNTEAQKKVRDIDAELKGILTAKKDVQED